MATYIVIQLAISDTKQAMKWSEETPWIGEKVLLESIEREMAGKNSVAPAGALSVSIEDSGTAGSLEIVKGCTCRCTCGAADGKLTLVQDVRS